MDEDNRAILNLIRSDSYITVNKKLAKVIGLHESIIYGELVSRYFYFIDHNRLTNDGYFFNTVEDLEEATTLSKHQQSKAIENLCKHNLIKRKVKGLPARRYFKINEDINQLLIVLKDTNPMEISQLFKKSPTNSYKIEQQDGNDLNSNNTTHNTSNIKQNIGYSTQNPVLGRHIFKFDILERQIKTCYKKVDISMNLDEVIYVFKYFTDKHKECCNFEHPNLSNKTIISILNNISFCDSDGTNEDPNSYDLDTECYETMINFYFTQNFNGNEKDWCDYSITHFMSGQIRMNCFYKTIYYN